jgi:ERAP1-like C-terminal domain
VCFPIQNRFTDNVADGQASDSLWDIPITYASLVHPSDTRPKFWLRLRQVNVLIDELTPESYFLVNVKQTGYYRVQYDEPNWMLIANELSHGNFSAIPPNSRAMLIDDAAVFFETKILNIRILLELIKYLQHDVSRKDDEENFSLLSHRREQFVEINKFTGVRVFLTFFSSSSSRRNMLSLRSITFPGWLPQII